jgi:hypothetical protein
MSYIFNYSLSLRIGFLVHDVKLKDIPAKINLILSCDENNLNKEN